MPVSWINLGALAGMASAYTCTSFTAPITVTAPAFTPAFPDFESHRDSVAWLNALTARNASRTQSPFAKIENATGTYDTSFKYCLPSHGHRYQAKPDVQILTHGIGFDKTYWDFGGQDSEYNYIRSATSAGYATLSYDRIGNGASANPDPYSIQNVFTETAILEAITRSFRAGTLQQHIPKPAGRVLHVGHSYGSIITNALVASYPDLSDGVALTGFSHNSTWSGMYIINSGAHLAKENQPHRFGGRSTGALTWGNELSNQFSFFAWPHFDPDVLSQAEATKFPFSIAEALTQMLPNVNATAFAGPVLVASGAADLIFCGGDCTGVLEQSASFFPTSKRFQTHVQPNTGHAMNLHHNVTGFYEIVRDFFCEKA